MKTDHAIPGTRQRLVTAMISALQRRGLHGIGLAELLETAQVPKGVLYHYFPGGKTALAIAAISDSLEALVGNLDALLAHDADPVQALRTWLTAAQSRLERTAFSAGCPLAAIALESTPDDADLRFILAHAFDMLRQCLSRVLEQGGLPVSRASAFAGLLVAAYEGALMQARVAGTGRVLTDTTGILLDLVARELREAKAQLGTPSV